MTSVSYVAQPQPNVALDECCSCDVMTSVSSDDLLT